VSGASAGALVSVAEAVSGLAAPDATERWSPLGGECLLAVDLGVEGGAPEPDRLEAARAALLQVPAPTVGLATRAVSPAGRALASRLDVIVTGEAELACLRRRVQAHPLAAMGLVQLLRHGEGRDVEAGLVAESLVYATLQAGPEFAAWRAARAPRQKPASPEPAVRVWRELDRLHLRLNRPDKRNAFSAEMRDALCEGLRLAVADASIERVVLSGEGACFSAGGDLDEFGTLPDPATAHAVRTTRSPARLLALCADRVRAELHGACIGAGIELPAFAARVVAREDAFAELPELAMGLVPGAGGTVSLPHRIGRQRTAWLALSGERIDAARGLAWGLFDEVSPA
jgi:hypothetical protein